MSSPDSRAIIAAAGSGKTQTIIDEALEASPGRVLITTFTNENREQITARIQQQLGAMPSHIRVAGWFSILLSEGARPYQRALTNVPGRIRSLNFVGRRNRFAPRDNIGAYYLDKSGDMYRDGISDFVCRVDEETSGQVIARLEAIFTHIFIDEVQDLVGYDLDFLELLFRSEITVTLVGDPRQHTYATNLSPRNKKYRGEGFVTWLDERRAICPIEFRATSVRCCQEICDFADALFPGMPVTTSLNDDEVEHRGVFTIRRSDVADYVARWSPIVLREKKTYNTCDLPAMNIGVSKGRTFDRVLIFSTKPMLNYVATRDLSKLKTNDRLYVAVTRAKYSATFVTDRE